jgi:NAD(P)-dependent dehydrogenase (short-subunit alcohol dehydrogenase family)
VLITGACQGVGRECAQTLAARGAELILADNDAAALSLLSQELNAVGRYCDVASEASVTIFAAELLAKFPELDMVINAAGGGYERTLGMYRVSRAFLPALRKGNVHNILLNIPPAEKDSGTAIFPYASSKQAFQRLCAALAAETRGSSVRVLIGCPHSEHVSQVLPDPNAGPWVDTCEISTPQNDDDGGLAAQIAALFDPADMDVMPFDQRSVA